jgi:hypothetical protein
LYKYFCIFTVFGGFSLYAICILPQSNNIKAGACLHPLLQGEKMKIFAVQTGYKPVNVNNLTNLKYRHVSTFLKPLASDSGSFGSKVTLVILT